MAYKQVDERFWKDAKVKRLSKDGYLFFLYLLTSPHTHYTGITEMNLDYVNIDTPLSEKESKAAFKELVALGIIAYDKQNKIVWIKNMHKYQVKSEKQLRGAQAHINSLPRSELCAALADTLSIPYRYPIDTPIINHNQLYNNQSYKDQEVKPKDSPIDKTQDYKEIPQEVVDRGMSKLRDVVKGVSK